MKNVKIVYNPFLLTTTFTVDGKKPNENSSLDFRQQRLQEWAEKLPQILLEEYRDKNIAIEFTGTLDDFSDLQEILKANTRGVLFNKFTHNRTPDVEEVEKKVVQLFKEISNGPVAELKDENIIKAFKEAMNSEFAINVVATMSSGKSSLINAILGRALMPVASMATTATVVRIIASDQNEYNGIAWNSKNEKVYEHKGLTLDILTDWNKNENISAIDIYGPIPCVSSVGMRLVIVDTPGPNNSRDKNHKKLTYDMLNKSEKSLVLFVMNATALNIENEADLLAYVCDCMKEGGKQSRDRFIFAVNKLDDFKPKNGDNVPTALKSVREVLDEKDIKNPNIFPISALSALEIRTKEEDPEALDGFIRKCNKYGDEYHFGTYYEYNHLPIPSRSRIQAMSESTDENVKILSHSGIPSIEEAIRLYVNKYARTMKVRDLVDAFNKRLTQLNAEANILDRISKDQDEKQKLEEQITRINSEIESGKSARICAGLIDSVDVTQDVRDDMSELVGNFQEKIDLIIADYEADTKIPKKDALKIIQDVEKERQELQNQLEAKISTVFRKTFMRTYDGIMENYRKHLQGLGEIYSNVDYVVNIEDIVGQEIADINTLVNNNVTVVDEGYNERRSREVRGEKKINWFWRPRDWFTERYETKTEYYTHHVTINVEYVNMHEVVNKYFVPMQTELNDLEQEVPVYLSEKQKQLKSSLKEELEKVDRILRQKLSSLQAKMNVANQTEAQIKKQKEKLKWMRGIKEQVNTLINYN